MTTFDAIVLAGDRGAARPVGDITKALLPLAGKPLLHYVLQALNGVPRVRRIIVVGPARELAPVLAGMPRDKPVELLEQGESAYQNFWSAFELARRDTPEDAELAVLVTAADAPLLSTREVEEFLDGCDLEHYDFCIGMTDARHLARFYPTADAPGIQMRYLHIADGSLRLNNLHLLRPLKVENREYIETIYRCRYQNRPWNMLRSVQGLLRRSGAGLRAVCLYLLLQLAQWSETLGWQRVRNALQRRVTRDAVCHVASAVLQTRATIVETTLGGAAIDVDNAEDYATLQARWEEFRHPPERA